MGERGVIGGGQAGEEWDEVAGWRALDRSLQELLATSFDPSRLHLLRVVWDSPASLLERVMAYERVHSYAGWDDMKRRLHGGGRIYTLMHPAMGNDPLVFVHVALRRRVPCALSEVLPPMPPAAASTPLPPLPPLPPPRSPSDGIVPPEEVWDEDANVAVFYSISSPHKGLRGVQLGGLLIKQAPHCFLPRTPSLLSPSSRSLAQYVYSPLPVNMARSVSSVCALLTLPHPHSPCLSTLFSPSHVEHASALPCFLFHSFSRTASSARYRFPLLSPSLNLLLITILLLHFFICSAHFPPSAAALATLACAPSGGSESPARGIPPHHLRHPLPYSRLLQMAAGASSPPPPAHLTSQSRSIDTFP